MAEAFNTLAGLVQLNDKNLADFDISDLLDDAPLMQVIFSQAASNGTLHKYLKQTVASSSAFREANAGLTKTVSQDLLVTDTLKILDGSFYADVALAAEYTKGKDAYLLRELTRTLKQAFFNVESQVLNGTNADSGGFVGLADDTQLDATTDAMVVNLAGSGVGTQASCYLLRSGEEDVSFIMGNEGNIVVDEDPSIIEKVVNPGTDNKTFPAYYTAVTGYSGFQIGGARSAARIANIEMADLTASDVFTDDSIYAAISLFPSARGPNLIVMNRSTQRLLRQSRTAVNATGAPAPIPESVGGVPIIVTDALLATEAVLV